MTIRALHASGVFEQFSTKRTSHDVVELLSDKLMAVQLMYLFLPRSDSAFTMQTSSIEWSSFARLFG
jgi:hypothetical protein